MKKYPNYYFVNLDLLDTCATTNNLKSIEDASNYTFVRGDIGNMDLVRRFTVLIQYHEFLIFSCFKVAHLMRHHKIDTVMHFAAQAC